MIFKVKYWKSKISNKKIKNRGSTATNQNGDCTPIFLFEKVSKTNTFLPYLRNQEDKGKSYYLSFSKPIQRKNSFVFNPFRSLFSSYLSDRGGRQPNLPGNFVCSREHTFGKSGYTGVCRFRPERNSIRFSISYCGS